MFRYNRDTSRAVCAPIIALAVCMSLLLTFSSNSLFASTVWTDPGDMVADWTLLSDPMSITKADFDPFTSIDNPMVLSGETLTFAGNGGEGLLAGSSDPDWQNIGTEFMINYEMGVNSLFGSSRIGAVWNMTNPDHDQCPDTFYYFAISGVNGGIKGLEIGKQIGLHDPDVILFSDPSIGVKKNTAYDVKITRSGSKHTLRIEEQGGPLLVDHTFMDDMFNDGTFGHFAENLFKPEWGMTHLTPVPEPESMAVAGMGALGILIFILGRRRRLSYQTVTT